jgi:hypothetical protein
MTGGGILAARGHHGLAGQGEILDLGLAGGWGGGYRYVRGGHGLRYGVREYGVLHNH